MANRREYLDDQYYVPDTRRLSAEIAEATEQFLKSGNRIQMIDTTFAVDSRSIVSVYDGFPQASNNKRKQRARNRKKSN